VEEDDERLLFLWRRRTRRFSVGALVAALPERSGGLCYLRSPLIQAHARNWAEPTCSHGPPPHDHRGSPRAVIRHHLRRGPQWRPRTVIRTLRRTRLSNPSRRAHRHAAGEVQRKSIDIGATTPHGDMTISIRHHRGRRLQLRPSDPVEQGGETSSLALQEVLTSRRRTRQLRRLAERGSCKIEHRFAV